MANGYFDFAKQLYAENVVCLYAEHICGEKKRFIEQIEEWKMRKRAQTSKSGDKKFEQKII